MVASSAPPARAQTQSLQVPIQFDFLNPGARSMSLGSAFVALADDATAAFTNPAGLDVLSKPEVSLEVRGRHFENSYLRGGRLSGTVTNQGVDTINGPDYGTADDDTTGLSFLSVVYPGKRWALAAYRHELVRIDESFQTQGAFFSGVAFGAPSNIVRQNPFQAHRSLDVTNYGVSLGVKVNDKVSVGAGVTFAHFKLQSSFLTFESPGDQAAADYSAIHQTQSITQNGDDNGVGFSVGTIVKPTNKFQFGAVYRRGASFTFSTLNQVFATQKSTQDEGVRFKTPDVFSLGGVWRPSEAVMVTVEYDFVKYSDIVKDYVTNVVQVTGRTSQFSIDDSNQIHAGFEYVFTQASMTPSVRVGAWYDPAHNVLYTPTAAHDASDVLFSADLPKQDSVVHYTFGAGLPINSHFELNGGADLSSRARLLSLSAVVRF
jgi:long-chain fatty acid transport protein